MSNLTQISLDFGPEHAASSSLPAGVGTAGGDAADSYMAAEGVGVRLKSYKRTPVSTSPDTFLPVNGDLFGSGGEEREAVMEPQVVVIRTEVLEPQVVVMRTEVLEPQVIEPQEQKIPHEVKVPQEAKIPVEPKRIAGGGRKAAPKKGKRGRKSLKEVAAEAELIEIPDDEVLFRKQYYTMGEVSEMFRVNQSLLRFWETEFDILQPRKNKKGDRYFRPIDIKNLHLIYHLLRQKKYTIEGAKDFLKTNKKAEERFEVIRRLQEIKAFLLEWKAQLG